jgi:hypothetical protein
MATIIPPTVGVILKLLDRCIQLQKTRQVLRRDQFKIQPLYEDFEKIHENYLESFAKYREVIITSESLHQDHQILDTIRGNGTVAAIECNKNVSAC